MIGFERKNIFEILKEAEEDENNDATASEGETSDNATDNGGEDQTAEEGNTDDAGEYEDFNIDTSLGEDDMDGDDGESGGEDDSSSSSDDSSDLSSSSSDSSDEEPVKANTNIFSSLTAEEQQIKIKNLKDQFQELYISCDDIKNKIDDIEVDETNMNILSRISSDLYAIKKYIKDYLLYHFDNKSFIENDVAFNRFLAILNSMANVLEEFQKVVDIKTGNETN